SKTWRRRVASDTGPTQSILASPLLGASPYSTRTELVWGRSRVVDRAWDMSGRIRASTHTLPRRIMTKWEYVAVPLIDHATKQILDQWGEDGYELVQVVPGPDNNGLVAYLK